MAIAYANRRERGRTPRAPAPNRGNWKLAYADFLTALVALFLVLWLVNDVPPEGRAELAGYFRGSDEVHDAVVASDARIEAEAFAAALRETRRLVAHSGHLQVAAEGERVRIEILDRSSDPLFVSGGVELSPVGMEMMAELAGLLAPTGWRVSIEGHTDAFPSAGSQLDNWQISSLRADSARRALLEGGLDETRLLSVSGLAATAPLVPAEPHLAANRRVSLVLQVAQ